MREIRTIGVIGAGQMGHGIAQVAAHAGFKVILQDISSNSLDQARRSIQKNLRKGIELGKFPIETEGKVLELIRFVTSIEEMAQADFVVESATENLDVKVQIFKTLDRVVDKDVILATNTSSQSVTYLASVTNRPRLVAGMHFFNPVHIMRLVEIIEGLETRPETIECVRMLAVKMGKETVVIKDFPGFATSRISAMLGNEAFYMLMEGLGTAEDIDKALTIGLNLPIGPLALGDMVGLDTRLKVLEHLHKNLGERFRPCPLMRKYVEAGRFGKKSGKGVYDYN